MKEKTVTEFKQMKDSNQKFQLIDVREEYEFDTANLDGELIPLGTILQNADKISKDIPVIIHCRSGSRSVTAINALEKKFGFTNLYNLKGGILAYSKEIDPSLNVH